MGPLGHIGETPGEALQPFVSLVTRIGHFEPSCSCFPITGQVLANSPGAGPFQSFGLKGHRIQTRITPSDGLNPIRRIQP